MESTLLIKRREAIILATIETIDECGVQAVSTKEIAKKQGVSERIILKHFPTKNDLFIAVLDYFTKYDEAIIQTAQHKEMKPIEAIMYFIDSYSTYYENYPAITAMTQSFDALRCNPRLEEKVISIFKSKETFIKQQIERAKEQNIIKMEMDTEGLADVILGTFMRLCLKWRIYNYSFSLRETTLSTIESILQSFHI